MHKLKLIHSAPSTVSLNLTPFTPFYSHLTVHLTDISHALVFTPETDTFHAPSGPKRNTAELVMRRLPRGARADLSACSSCWIASMPSPGMESTNCSTFRAREGQLKRLTWREGGCSTFNAREVSCRGEQLQHLQGQGREGRCRRLIGARAAVAPARSGNPA